MDSLRDRAISAYKEHAKKKMESTLKQQEANAWALHNRFLSDFGATPDKTEGQLIYCIGLRFLVNDINTWSIIDTCGNCGDEWFYEVVDLIGLGKWLDTPGPSFCERCQEQSFKEKQPLWKRVLGWE